MSRRSSINVEEIKSDMRQIQAEVAEFFSFKTRRNRGSLSQEIVIDPASFVIGGIGAVAVGCLAEESHEVDQRAAGESPHRELVVNSALRIITFPIRSLVRFLVGGCIYVTIETVMLRLFNKRAPYVSGAITASCFSSGARPGVFIGSIVGMAIFSTLADLWADSMIQ